LWNARTSNYLPSYTVQGIACWGWWFYLHGWRVRSNFTESFGPTFVEVEIPDELGIAEPGRVVSVARRFDRDRYGRQTDEYTWYGEPPSDALKLLMRFHWNAINYDTSAGTYSRDRSFCAGIEKSSSGPIPRRQKK
jgi:hypothetical protein